MKNATCAAIAAAAVMTFAASNAMAAKKCNIVGSFTDSLGSTGKFTSEKKGTVMNTAICPTAYKLTVTKLTTKIIDIKGTTKACGALTGAFTFATGSCDSASGTVTIQGIGSFPDTITRSGADAHRASPDTSALTAHMK